ncbi:MAG: DNA polymerase III subunit epsilon [Bifidobacteriaceae bacterium]|jgi:DNA polymerase-3 subunit epsilon|nr:DNA polymerase III subunit epsilon [Bifidobacteriaceae bacterium]
MRQLIGFDTETTGVDVTLDRIVTAAVVRRAADGTTQTQTWLINPGVAIPERATAIHGITTERAQTEGMPPDQALEEVARALTEFLITQAPVLAFNAAFDLRLVEAELARHGLPPLSQRLGRDVAPVVDPLVLDRALVHFRKGKRRLDDLMAAYGVPSSDNLHDALEDVHQAIAVFDAIEAKYERISQMDAMALHKWQTLGHRKWAESFNRWLVGRGEVGDVDLAWP